MKRSLFIYKELTPAEVGKTGTHEVYIRLPNNFDYESFFGNSAVMNGSVVEVNFMAIDKTNGGNESTPLRFVYFLNSNKEKRIPSLGALFKSHGINEGDIVCLESRIGTSDNTYFIRFYRKGQIQINPSSIYFSKIDDDDIQRIERPDNNLPLQQIYYGAPGTGKSHAIEVATEGQEVIRTTFHPDSDYSTFVGAYKPTTKEIPMRDVTGKVIIENGKQVTENRIVYEFVSQAFLQAYVGAWEKFAANDEQPQPQYLVIEEINRGNCAQIFGDLFQLLDRNAEGFSEYPIKADADMKKQLKKLLSGLTINNAEAINALYKGKDVVSQVLDGDILLLPSNLFIWATMNTSDQSLFPIDSAFKRRWDWKYVRIDNAGKGWKIQAQGKLYDWWDFLEKINTHIGETTSSEDKKLGYFFCKTADGIISAETFVSKVIFYLWNDVFKDYEFEGDIFVDEDKTSKLSFDKFYITDAVGQTVVNEAKVVVFLTNLGVKFADDNTMFEGEEEDEDGNTASSSGRDFTKYSVNGIGRYGKNRLAAEAVKQYVLMNPSLSAEEVVTTWKSLGNIVAHFIETKEEHDARQDNSKRSQGIPCGGTVIYVEVNGYGSNGKVDVLIEAVNRQNWGLSLSKVES